MRTRIDCCPARSCSCILRNNFNIAQGRRFTFVITIKSLLVSDSMAQLHDISQYLWFVVFYFTLAEKLCAIFFHFKANNKLLLYSRKKGISHHYHNNTNDVKVMSVETNLNLFLKHHICADDFTSLPVTSDALVMNPNCTKCLSYRLFSAAY